MMTEKERLKRAARESLNKISKSEIFLSIFSDNYKEDPVCLMQLAISILLDKPIFLLVIKGTIVPKGLIRISTGYVFCENTSDKAVKLASEKLMVKVEKYLEEQGNE